MHCDFELFVVYVYEFELKVLLRAKNVVCVVGDCFAFVGVFRDCSRDVLWKVW